MRGRPPTPTALKLLKGNPGKRRLESAEPQPLKKAPPCPKHLVGEARKEWRRITKQLLALGLLTEIDRAALAGYCQAWARWVEAEEAMQKPGFQMITLTGNGYPVLSPWLGVANTALKQMRSFLSEFGMTPSARVRVKVEAPRPKDPYEAYLNGDG